MKCAYEAANGVEAHMIANLFEQQHIHARIDGEHLTSGIGELPAVGLVRVMVNADDYERAREIIGEWERSSPVVENSPSSRSIAPVWFMLGVLVGMAIMGLLIG